MGGFATKAAAKYSLYPFSAGEDEESLCRVKKVFGQSSSSWRLIKASLHPSTSKTQRPELRLFLSGDEKPDLVLRDSDRDGWYDAADHIGKKTVEATDASLPVLAIDTSEDGKADVIVMDTRDSGRYDVAVSRAQAPLSFLVTMSKVGPKDSSEPGPWKALDTEVEDKVPLSPGWERVKSASQGRFYYSNRDLKRVTWNLQEVELPSWPMAMPAAATTEDDSFEGWQGRPVALGWEMKISKSRNKPYFVHKITGQTTWDVEEATLPAPAPELPVYWRNSGIEFFELVHTSSIFRHVQMLLAQTFLYIRTRDRKVRLPDALEALKIWRVENSAAWAPYETRRRRLLGLAAGRPLKGCEPVPKTTQLLDHDLVGTIVRPGAEGGKRQTLLEMAQAQQEQPNVMEQSVNETYLFHGTSGEGVLGIVNRGFDASKSTSASAYGPGAYFAECSSKADEYAREDTAGLHKGHCAMLLCRVLLGRVLHCETEFTPELEKAWKSGSYDSILGDRAKLRGTYREFVLPPEACSAVYPEYLIIYRRRYEEA